LLEIIGECYIQVSFGWIEELNYVACTSIFVSVVPVFAIGLIFFLRYISSCFDILWARSWTHSLESEAAYGAVPRIWRLLFECGRERTQCRTHVGCREVCWTHSILILHFACLLLLRLLF
jgi:hypothetical protein